MTEHTIIVEFEVLEGHFDEFVGHMVEHARRTLEEEPGCLRFEVVQPIERDGTPQPNRVIVNELYASAAAVTAHEQNPRMPSLQALTQPLLKSRRLILSRALLPRHGDESLAPEDLTAANDA